ncbi:B-cell receptor CD22 isoform X2 [Chelmon rostratus]|uniref:B-cell receptor CD22 isoform X2 n=1 Tax=Chelmon rostratus TaxID=109905 RepID=UPI001BE8957D|nr:B-cell receptor CD22 isoform X2 [Chelmon rostratus]
MKMYVQTVGWFVFLTLLTNFSYTTPQILFKLDGGPLTAQEGSCIEIQCRSTFTVNDQDAYWFWMKDSNWNGSVYIGTVIYSTDTSLRPVSPDFAGRVKYIGSPSSHWQSRPQDSKILCSILICNLTTTDSGSYSFRFVGKYKEKWKTDEVNLTVTENPCPITFQKPPPVTQSATVTLTCSTLSSCPSNPQIKDPPQGTLAKVSSTNIKEGDRVTLTCFAKGRPAPTFTWFRNKQKMSSEAEWKIPSIQGSESGQYYCEANNTHGKVGSNTVIIDVTYAPQVEVSMTSPAVVKQGDEIALTCDVRKSNPQPHTYSWFKDGVDTGCSTYQYVKRVEPEDSGSFTCSATNSVGTGTSQPLQIMVQYGPRNTKISKSENTENVKVGNWLTFYCNTEANPVPVEYSWYRYKAKGQFNPPQWTSHTTKINRLTLHPVQRTDEGCYTCNATNSIKTGDDSGQVCIKVLYPPTNLKLSMDTEAREGQLIVINCTVESSPPSSLTLIRTSKPNAQRSELSSTRPFTHRDSNTLKYTINVTSTHAGLYTCQAKNSEGSSTSKQRELEVKYRPKAVTVEARPSLIVNENASLTLKCIAQSHPAVTSFTWMKTTDLRGESFPKTQTLQMKSVSPSDRGLYSCAATNEMGTGRSQPANVEVMYAPKHTNITREAEQKQPKGRSSVRLNCSSDSYPPATEYSWYKKRKDKQGDVKVFDRQSYTVYSDKPGVYYCIAKNELSQKSSDPVELFVDRGFMTALMYTFLAILLLVLILFFVYRHKRNKSIQQGSTSTPSCFGFLGWWNCAGRRNLTSEPVTAEPFRSRDDLLPEQRRRPQAQQRQPRPDTTPASNINSVYCTVNLPAAKQGPSAQKPVTQQGGHTKDESLNYASVHFGNKQMKKLAEENVVYAMVSKQKPAKKNEPKKLVDYENVSAAHAAKSPNPLNYDTDTSEDEVELNYSQVNFKAKTGHQRAARDSSSDSSSDSSTSDEEETQYSQVKI